MRTCVEAGELAQLFGEVVVQLGQTLLLDAIDLHGVDESLAGKPLVGGVFGIAHVEGALLAGRSAGQVLGKFRNRVLAADFDQHVVHVHGIRFGFRDVFAIFGLAVHRGLGEVALGQRASFDGGVGRVLLAHAVERLLDFLVGDGDLRLVGAQIFVALDLNLGQHFKRSLEGEGLAVVHVQVGDARLRNRNQAQLLGFPAKVFRNQSLGHVALQAFAKALLDDGSRHMPGAKPRQPGTLLIALNLKLGFAGNLGGRDLDRDLALDVFVVCFRLGRVGGFCGAHVCLSLAARFEGSVWRRKLPEFIRR